VFIPKPGSRERRPPSIPSVRDRIVQAACKIVLEPVFAADMVPCSYRFRPRRGAHGCPAGVDSRVAAVRPLTTLDPRRGGRAAVSDHQDARPGTGARSAQHVTWNIPSVSWPLSFQSRMTCGIGSRTRSYPFRSKYSAASGERCSWPY
jgi:hypothetical protein